MEFLAIALVLALIGSCAFLLWRLTKAKVQVTDVISQKNEHEKQIEELKKDLQKAQENEKEQIKKIAEIETELKNQTDRFHEQGKFEKRMKETVEGLTRKALEHQGDRFKTVNREEMGKLIEPLQKDIKNFKNSFENLKTDTTKERERLLTQFSMLQDTTAKISKEANDLTNALKGDKKKLGVWGESVLDTVLQNSGLREGEEYSKQKSVVAENGKRLVPDVIVKMPSSKERVIIDAKVSLNNFQEYASSADEKARDKALDGHVQAIRNHVKNLSSKDYQGAIDSDLDFVIMFMPIEAAFAAAVEKDMRIAEYAIEHRVILATPTTLLLALRTIANLWRVERRNSNADQIAKRGGMLHDKVVLFLESFKQVGDSLDQARRTYDEAEKRLKSGKGNVVGQTEKLRSLGASPSKQIPDHWQEDDIEDEDQPKSLPE